MSKTRSVSSATRGNDVDHGSGQRVSAVACERRNLSVAPTGGAILAMT
jgi:hypothetical protein